MLHGEISIEEVSKEEVESYEKIRTKETKNRKMAVVAQKIIVESFRTCIRTLLQNSDFVQVRRFLKTI